MGVLQLAKLVELLNAGDSQRCGCAEGHWQQWLADENDLARAKTAPGRYSSSQILDSHPQDSRVCKTLQYSALPIKAREEQVGFCTGLVDASYDSDSESSISSPRLASELWLGPEKRPPEKKLSSGELWLGPEKPPEKISSEATEVSQEVTEASLLDSSHQSISWELPPLAIEAPIPSEVGTSMWSASRPLYTPSVAPSATTPSLLPFSALLRQALEHVAGEAPLVPGHRQSSQIACAPPALEVPRTQLERKDSYAGRKLSAAQIWLGVGPSD